MSHCSRRRFMVSSLGALSLAPQLLWGAGTYVVKAGDTLSEIALKYKVSVGELKAANGLRSDLIRIGQRLTIPSAVSRSYTDEVRRVTAGLRIPRGRWKYIVAHHSAIADGNATSYGNYHKRRGMENGLAYHFVIGNGRDSGDGEIEIGPRWHKQLDGGHVRRHSVNQQGIGICMVGNYQETRPTPRQMAAFVALVSFLGNDLLKGAYKFMVHKEVDKNHTVCPGRYFPVKEMHRRFN